MYIGVDYYPEHWPRERWEEDARLMAEAGFNVVRLAEFAWSRMEPAEGRFEFAWLDEAIETLDRRGIRVVLGTPTASMPPWAAVKYPEVMALRPEGGREPYGHRKYACLSCEAYRMLSERITETMCGHYAGNRAVIGWQTDNEFDAHPCACDSCRRAFQDWLREKYGAIDELNQAWGTVFWSHEFGNFTEVPLPLTVKTVNPGMALDHKRFVTFLNAEFQRAQARIMRERCPGHFITHNFQESFTDLDYFEMAKDIDFPAWNSYPIWGKPGLPYSSAAMADVLRGLKGGNFWTMEQVCGNQGWSYMSRSVRPGEIRRLIFQQVAHGADGFLWFRWRTCPFGWEQNAHGMLSYDGVPRRRYRECAAATRDLRSVEKEIAGTRARADVALLLDYESSWSIRVQPGFIENAPGWWLEPGAAARLNDYREQFMRYYRALLRAGVNVDVVARDGDFSDYRLLISPELVIMPDAAAGAITGFVRNGGTLLTDLRSDLKDERNSCHQRLLPGLLRETLKIRIEEYESLAEDALIAGRRDFPGRFHGHIGCDWVIPEGAQVLAGYANDYLKGYAALTLATSGRGRAYYVGTIAREEAFYDRLIAHALKTAGIKRSFALPPGVELASRETRDKRLHFFINHNPAARKIKLPAGIKARALLGDKPKAGKLVLPGGSLAILLESGKNIR